MTCLLYTIFLILASTDILKIESEGSVNLVGQSVGAITAKLYNVLSAQQGNILVSPLCINYVLTATSLAARGTTLEQLKRALAQPVNNDEILKSYREFTDLLRMREDIITVSTEYFIDSHFLVKQKFIKDLSNDFFYMIGIHNYHFSESPEEARIAVNKYIDGKSNHLIPELFPTGSINRKMAAMILNGIYFKSQWLQPFKPSSTIKSPFYELVNTSSVEMMHQKGWFNYAEDDSLGAKILELPLKGGFSFGIILPNTRNGITDLENKIRSRSMSNPNATPFNDIFANMRSEWVDLRIPKFKMGQSLHLIHQLRQIGVVDMFSPAADLSGLSQTPLFINDVIQKTYIDINENGIVSTATGTSELELWYRKLPNLQKFKANHPFIYVMKEQSTGTPVFVGRFANSSPQFGTSAYLFIFINIVFFIFC